MLDVVALGEILIDFAQTKVDEAGYPTLSANPGGAPANFLAPIAKYGMNCAMIGKIGDDTFGRLLTNTMKTCGIETRGLLIDDYWFTTLAFVTLDKNGDRSFAFSRRPGADTQFTFKEVDLSLIDECKVFHFGSLSLCVNPSRSATKKTIDYAKKKGKLISYDPNLRKPLWDNLEEAKKEMIYGLKKAAIVKISDEEVEFLFGIKACEACAFLLKKFKNIRLLYVTCGAKGYYYATRKFNGFIESLKNIQAIDTTGAGDIFGGSAMVQLLRIGKPIEELSEQDLKKIVTFATAAAGLSTTKLGGISSVASLKEVENAVNQI